MKCRLGWHQWTLWGPPYVKWHYGHRQFQARTCERCGRIGTRRLEDGQDGHTDAPMIPIERDLERLK